MAAGRARDVRSARWSSPRSPCRWCLLAGAGLLIRSFIALQNVDPGMRTEGVLTARVSLSGQRYDNDQKLGGFFTDVLSRITAIPGVENAAAVSFLPMAGLGIGTSFYRLDRPTPEPGQHVGHRRETGNAELLQDDGDSAEGGPRLHCRRYRRIAAGRHRQRSPGAAAVPERGSDRQAPERLHRPRARRHEREIVGVVGDIKMVTLDGTIDPAVYIPHTQLPIGVMTFVVRTSLEPTSLTRQASPPPCARSIANLPLADVATMDDCGRQDTRAPARGIDIVDGVCGHRARAGGRRRLRRDGVFRVAAHAGDRRAHGARRDHRSRCSG